MLIKRKTFYAMGWLLLASMLVGVASAYGAVAYKAQDHTTKALTNGQEPQVSGNYAVSIEKDAKGATQVALLELKSGSKKLVTDTETNKNSPRISGDTVVWLDRGINGNQSFMWDVYSYSIKTGETRQLNAVYGILGSLSISGDFVVWFRQDTSDIYVYNLKKEEEEIAVAKGRAPIVGNGKIVFAGAMDNNLNLYDIATAKTRVLMKPPIDAGVVKFVFNGTYVVWKQTKKGESKIVMLNTAQAGAKPVDLTKPSAKKKEYGYLSIGSTQAAWMEDVNGKTIVKGVNLPKSETYTIGESNSARNYWTYSGDELLTTDAKGTLIFRKMVRN